MFTDTEVAEDITLLQRSKSNSLSSGSLADKHSSSFPWILHHILEKQPSDELPLRIMFTFNAGQQLPTLRQVHTWWEYEPSGRKIIDFLSKTQSTNIAWNQNVDSIPSEHPATNQVDKFVYSNQKILWDLSHYGDTSNPSSRVKGFPVQFVQQVCRKVFTQQYEDIDFSQALTCIDYLRDLECTRRTALRDVALRLGIEKENWRVILADAPEAYRWVSSVQKQELVIESLYAAIFVDLRIWTMVNELRSVPFYKPNVLAMLNTLFPPSMKDMPNDKVDIVTLQKHRATFYKYILAVEQQGSHIVEDFVKKLLQPEIKHSWPGTVRELDEYINLADSMIEEAKDIEGSDFFHDSSSVRRSRTTSTAYSTDRPPTVSSANTNYEDYRFSFASASSPTAINNNNKTSSSTIAEESDNLFDADSTFIPPSSSTDLPTDPIINALAFSQQNPSISTIFFDSLIASPSAGESNDLAPQIFLAASSIQPSRTTFLADVKDSSAHSNPVADDDMRRIKRAISRSASKSEPPPYDNSNISYNSSSTTPRERRPAQGTFDFLSHPYQADTLPELDHTATIKRKKSFRDIFCRKSSTAKVKDLLHDKSTPKRGRNEPGPLRKLKSTSHLNLRPRAQASPGISEPSPFKRLISRSTADQHQEERMGMLSPDWEKKKSFSFGRSRAPKHITIPANSSVEHIPTLLRKPTTPSLFSRPITPTFFNRPDSPLRDPDSPLPILGYASSIIGLEEPAPESPRKSIFALPSALKKKLSRSTLKDEEDREVDMERERQWLIEKRLRERNQSPERTEAGKENKEQDTKENKLERKGSRKEMVWQDGGASGKASGWVEFVGPRKLAPVPHFPAKSVFRSENH